METRIKLRAEDLQYLQAYFTQRELDPKRCEPWMSVICTECGELAASSPYPHLTDDAGIVLICCEGYFQINPNSIGLDNPNWSDWHEEIGDLEPPAHNPCRHCGQSMGECLMRKGLEMPNCYGLCNHEEG